MQARCLVCAGIFADRVHQLHLWTEFSWKTCLRPDILSEYIPLDFFRFQNLFLSPVLARHPTIG